MRKYLVFPFVAFLAACGSEPSAHYVHTAVETFVASVESNKGWKPYEMQRDLANARVSYAEFSHGTNWIQKDSRGYITIIVGNEVLKYPYDTMVVSSSGKCVVQSKLCAFFTAEERAQIFGRIDRAIADHVLVPDTAG